jgi:hypothetical protein
MRRFGIPVRPVGGGVSKYRIDPTALARWREKGWTIERIAQRYGWLQATERALGGDAPRCRWAR